MRRALSVWSVLVVAVLLLGACGSSGNSSSDGSGGTRTIAITVRNGKIRPHGIEVKAEKGKPIRLRITSDTAGELHVHSSPEQEVPFHRGTTLKTLTIRQPGIVDIEDHQLDTLVVQLQVS